MRLFSVGIKPKLGLNIAILLIMVSFAANSVITRYMVSNDLASAFALTVIRFVSGLVMLTLLRLTVPKAFPRFSKRRSNVIGGIFLASYGFSISFGFLFIGAAAGTFILYASVLLSMAVYSVIVEHERFRPRQKLGLMVAVFGIFALTYGGVATVTLLGVSLMIITGVSWGSYSIFGRRSKNAFGYTFYTFAVVSLFAFPSQIIFSPSDLLMVPISIQGLGLALYFGMISTALSYVLWHKVLKRIKTSQGGVYQMIVPVLAAVMGIFLLSEQVTLSLLAGGGLIVFGIFLNR